MGSEMCIRDRADAGDASSGDGGKDADSTVVDADFEEVNPDADDAPKGKKGDKDD